MAKYRIKTIAHLLKNNKIAKSGDIVDGSLFVNLQQSLDGNYCELADEPSDSKQAKNKKNDDSKMVKSLNKQDLIDYAAEHRFKINPDANKKTILNQVLDQIENGAVGLDEEE